MTQPAQFCQGEYDLSIEEEEKRDREIKQAGWLGVCLPRLSPACLTAYLPACADRGTVMSGLD